ncbi:MAG: TIM barrel protein [Oscillospiraceae bacterium]|nr:TIM barrel protein [Oscillospiraceae bacterium]
MNEIIFATAGKPDSFAGKYPADIPSYLAEFGLNGFEVECGRGVISPAVCDLFEAARIAEQTNLSLHAPYYISLSSVEEEKRDKSVGYIIESALAAAGIGARRVIVHSGSCAKISRETALEYALDSLKNARAVLDELGLESIILCPETMGKINQLGTLEEVLALCSFDERMIPCVDFGHLNARTHGGIKSRDDYSAILDSVADKLGQSRMKNMHIHFSRIEYTMGGEKKHLTFREGEARGFGPDYRPLMEEIAARRMTPFIVCESDGTQAEDCAEMAKCYRSVL